MKYQTLLVKTRVIHLI